MSETTNVSLAISSGRLLVRYQQTRSSKYSFRTGPRSPIRRKGKPQGYPQTHQGGASVEYSYASCMGEVCVFEVRTSDDLDFFADVAPDNDTPREHQPTTTDAREECPNDKEARYGASGLSAQPLIRARNICYWDVRSPLVLELVVPPITVTRPRICSYHEHHTIEQLRPPTQLVCPRTRLHCKRPQGQVLSDEVFPNQTRHSRWYMYPRGWRPWMRAENLNNTTARLCYTHGIHTNGKGNMDGGWHGKYMR